MSKRRALAHLSVWLGQTLVGTIMELPNDRNIFVFDESYIEDSDRPMLNLSFYDAEGRLDWLFAPFLHRSILQKRAISSARTSASRLAMR